MTAAGNEVGKAEGPVTLGLAGRGETSVYSECGRHQ